MTDWGRCIAIVDGRRCKLGARAHCPVTFAWDPIKGVGIGGPHVPLCSVHNSKHWRLKGGERFRIIGGWYGYIWNSQAKVWTVLQSVFRSRTSHKYADAWWSLRFNTEFGVFTAKDRQTFDEARAALKRAA